MELKTERLDAPFTLAHTDGSCPNNKTVSYDNPAGWGFNVTTVAYPSDDPPVDDTWIRAWGPDKTNPTETLHPLPGSNKTGEVKTLIDPFDFFPFFYSPYSDLVQVAIYTGSQYALSVIQGDALPTIHHQLIIGYDGPAV